MNTYKYKEAGNGEYIKFTTPEGGETIKSPSFNEKNKPGFFAEMQEWLSIEGNEIEPQFTAEELSENEAQEAENVISTANSEARAYLSKTDKWCSRHRDQIDNGNETSLTDIQFKKLLTKRQTARDKITDSEPIDLD